MSLRPTAPPSSHFAASNFVVHRREARRRPADLERASSARARQVNPGAASAQYPVEGAPEVAHRACVDDGVHRRVDVAEPREDRKHHLGVRHAAHSAHREQVVGDEERHPAHEEGAHDDAERLRRFLFLREPVEAPAQREALRPLAGRREVGRDGAGGRVGAGAGVARTAVGVAVVAAAVNAQRHSLGSPAATHHLGAGGKAARLLGRSAVDAEVGEQDERDGRREGHGGGEQEVGGVVREGADVGGRRDRRRAPPNDRREADGSGAEPDGGDQRHAAAGRHPQRVVDRVGDRPVAVERDHRQVEDRRGAGEHVDRVPQVARVGAEQPAAAGRQLDDGAQRHHAGADDEIGRRERHDEVVGDGAQRAFARHGRHHEQVTADGDEREEGEQEAEAEARHLQSRGWRRRGRGVPPRRRVDPPRGAVNAGRHLQRSERGHRAALQPRATDESGPSSLLDNF